MRKKSVLSTLPTPNRSLAIQNIPTMADGGGDKGASEEIAESLRKMAKIVNNLSARADCEPFREPVDWKALELYDYPKIIKKMMDLGSIKQKLEKGTYSDAAECADDVRLVWKNCMNYNADGSDFYRLGDSYSKRFEERFQKLVDEFGEDVICGNIATQAAPPSKKKSRSSPLPNSSSTKKHKSDKKSFDPKGIIPLDVKTRFAARLQRLSGMELGHVLSVIDEKCPEALEEPPEDQLRSDAQRVTKRHNYALDEFDGGSQIEIDIDSIPSHIFGELDLYVKEQVSGRGRGPWSDELLTEDGTKKKKVKT